MNPKIWQLIKDYMTRGKGEKWREISELEPWMEDVLRKEEEGMEAAMQEGMVDEDAYNDVMADLVSLDEHELMLDHYGIYQKDDPVYARAANERVALYKRLDDLGKEKKKTRKLKKSSRGHSRYGRGGGAIPMDVLESKTAPRGLLGPRKRKY